MDEKTRRRLTRQETKRIYTRAPVDLVGWFGKQAERQGLSVNALLVEALAEYKERHRPGPRA